MAGAAAREGMERLEATIIRSGLLKTNAKYRPSPSLFYFPGLTSRPFHNPKLFPWVQTLEAEFATIKKEYLALRQAQMKSDYQTDTEHSLHTGQWDWHSYVLKGQFQDAFRQQCPETARLLHSLHRQGSLMAGTPFSFAFFSTLHPGAEIAAHTAPSNLRLRCHLPLIVPPFPPKDEPDPHAKEAGAPGAGSGGDYETMEDAKAAVPCGMRIGESIRHWEEGKAIVFDDAYEHEVWNRTKHERVLLLVDFWHPEIEPGERQAILNMFDFARQQGWMAGAAAGTGTGAGTGGGAAPK